MQQGNPTSLRVPDPGIAALFEQDARWQAWLDVEAALAAREDALAASERDLREREAALAEREVALAERRADGARATRPGKRRWPIISIGWTPGRAAR